MILITNMKLFKIATKRIELIEQQITDIDIKLRILEEKWENLK